MIALVLGVFVIGGIITVFVSNQQTYRVTVALDNSQEAFRFASHVITRSVRSATSIQTSSDDENLVLELPRDGITRNCLGILPEEELDVNGVPVTQINRFSLNVTDLECTADGDGTAVVVSGVTQLLFSYAALDPGDYTPDAANPYGDVATAGTNSIRTEITMADAGGIIRAPQISFTAAARARLIPLEIVIRPGEPTE